MSEQKPESQRSENQVERPLTKCEFAGPTTTESADAKTALLAIIVESSDDAILAKRLDGTILTWNRGAERIFGYRADEIIGKHIKILIPAELEHEEDFIVSRIAEGKSVDHLETVRVRKDGRKLDVSLTISPILDAEGKVIGASKVLHDVTETKRAEAKLRAVVDHAVDGVITIDEHGMVESFNPACERIFGYAGVEVIGHNIKMLMPEPYHSEHDGYLSHYSSTGEARIIGTAGREVSGKRKDGSVFPMDLSVSYFELDDGKHYSGIIRDITERKRAEAKLRAVVDHAIDGLIAIDEFGVVESFNPACERIFGYTGAEVIGRNIKMLMPEPYHSEHDGYLSHHAKTGEARIIGTAGREVSGKRKDGSVFPMDLSVSGFELKDGKHYSGIIRDITARKQADAERNRTEAELIRYTQALERSNSELDAFAFAASHDLKAPLRVIQNATTWLEEDLEQHHTAESRENMNLIRARVRRMEKLLNDLLEYSRIGRDTVSRPTETVSGAAMMENILELLVPPPEFIVDVTPPLKAIEVSRMPLQQILMNLISNGIKHHDKPSGRVEVGVDDIGTHYRFTVRDDGPGIPEQFHEQIFKMFQTLKPRDQVEGSGMGLAIVRKQVELSGGELKLESSVGHGSAFSFTWPKSQANADKDPEVADARERQNGLAH